MTHFSEIDFQHMPRARQSLHQAQSSGRVCHPSPTVRISWVKAGTGVRHVGDLARPLVQLPELEHLTHSLDFTLYDVTQLGQDLRLRLRPDQSNCTV